MDENVLRNLLISDNDSLQKVRSYYFSVQALLFTVIANINDASGGSKLVDIVLVIMVFLVNWLWHTHQNNYLAKVDYISGVLVDSERLENLDTDDFYRTYFCVKEVRQDTMFRKILSGLPYAMFVIGAVLILYDWEKNLCLFG